MADDIKGTTHFSNLTVEEDITSIGDDLTLTDDLTVGGAAAVTGNVTVTGSVLVDTITEKTSAAGCTVESVKLEDGEVQSTTLKLNSTNPLTVALNAVDSLQLDNAAISAFAAATDTVGRDVFAETQDAGGTATAARVGGALSVKCGDGSAGAAAVAGGAGGAAALAGGLGGATSATGTAGAGGAAAVAGGAGGANTGGATGAAAGAGGAASLVSGAGGATDSTGAHAGGAGGALALTGGAGGAATAGTGDGGAGGSLTLTPGAGGATTGGSAGAKGQVYLAGQTNIYTGALAAGLAATIVGPTATEGLKTVVQEETLSPAAVETALATVIPKGSVIRAVLANVQTALTGGSTTVTWSVGVAADPDKYGTAGHPTKADALTKNSKSNWINAALVQLTADETIVLTGAATGGTADGDTALTVGTVRIVVIYDTFAQLANAA